MSSEFIFLIELSHAINLKAKPMTSRIQILTAKQ